MLSPFLSLATLASVASAVSLCGQFDYFAQNGYNYNNNEWGKDSGSGSGCVYIDATYTTGGIFHVNWNWSGGNNNVKAYPYIGNDVAKGRKLSSINSINTEVYWSYTGSNIRADVAYDLFSAADPNHNTGSGDYELMVWLAAIGGVQPLGKPQETTTIGGISWTLWYGTNPSGSQRTYSFVPSNGKWLEAYKGNIMDFWHYLRDHKGYPANNQYLLVNQFGTEPFTGSNALFNVTWYTANIA